MFKFFRKLDKQVFQGIQHDEYAEETLANARREFLVACDQMEHWEAMKNYRAKQIERLEKYVQENPTKYSASVTSSAVLGSTPLNRQHGLPILNDGP